MRLIFIILFSLTALFANEKKLAEFDLEPYFPFCLIGSSCWHDYMDWGGIEFDYFKLKVEKSTYGVRTDKEVIFYCEEQVVKIRIKQHLKDGESSQWIKNPCFDYPRKITSKVGISNPNGTGRIGYYVRSK